MKNFSSMRKEVLAKLKDFPDFRERRFRGQYFTILALRKSGLETRFNEKGTFSLEELSTFAIKYDSYRNAWDDILKDDATLRGKDYDDGETLRQEIILNKGY